MKSAHLPHSKVVNNRAVILTLNRSSDLSNTALCRTTYSPFWCTLTGHPRLTQGLEGPCNGKAGAAWQCKLVDFWIQKMLKLWRGEIPTNASVWLPEICWLTDDAGFHRTEQKEGPLSIGSSLHMLVKVDARVRVVDCMCKECATHVTSNMHPAAVCRDSCDNPILVKSLGPQIGCRWVPSIHASNIYCDSPTGFVSRCRRSCLWAFPMHALAGCTLLSGCLKCCGTSSLKWRF